MYAGLVAFAGAFLLAVAPPAQAQIDKRAVQREEQGERFGQHLRKLAESGVEVDQQRDLIAKRLRSRKLPRRTVNSALRNGAAGLTLRPTSRPALSRLGGASRTTTDAVWPTNRRSGLPLSPMAVLDLAELRAQPPLPPDGTLVFYYDAAGAEHGTDAWLDPAACADVRWIPPGRETVEVSAPAGAWSFPAQPVTGTPMFIIGGYDYLGLRGPDKDVDHADTFLSGLRSAAYSGDQLLGRSQDLQTPVMGEISYWFKQITDRPGRERYTALERKGKGWTLLAQVSGAGSDEMMFGDAGNVSFAIPTGDLAQRRFDRSIAIFQTH